LCWKSAVAKRHNRTPILMPFDDISQRNTMNRTLWRTCSALLAVTLITAQAPETCLAADDIVVEENITYGQGGDVDLKLDLARPKEGSGPFPTIVCIHGGGWLGGNRQSYRPLIESAAKKGYVAVTITYRLTQPDPETKVAKYPYPAQIHDCKCAVRWLRSVAEKYHINKDRIGVTGGSAGGHLSLLVGLADEKAGLEGDSGHSDQSSRVQAVVNVFGPTDLAVAYEDVPQVRDLVKALCGGTPETAAENYKAASPVTYISKDDPPVLTLHGDQDKIVLVSQATLLDAAMKKGGARHELVILKDQGHGFAGDAAKQANDATWAFFDRELKNSSQSK
jgi:acetyl esterase/lipase